MNRSVDAGEFLECLVRSSPISRISGCNSVCGSGVFDAESCRNGAVLYLLESFGLSRTPRAMYPPSGANAIIARPMVIIEAP